MSFVFDHVYNVYCRLPTGFKVKFNLKKNVYFFVAVYATHSYK